MRDWNGFGGPRSPPEDESDEAFLVAGGLIAGRPAPRRPTPRAQASGTARGKVLDDKGQPIAGRRDHLEFQGGVTRKYETKTNKKGEFTQVGLVPGRLQDHGHQGGLPGRVRRRRGSASASPPSCPT